MTGPSCTEQFVKNRTLPLRALLCVRAYRKFTGLYDFALLTASTNNGLMSLQSRLDARGVSYENGMLTARMYMDTLQLSPAPCRPRHRRARPRPAPPRPHPHPRRRPAPQGSPPRRPGRRRAGASHEAAVLY